MKNILRGVYASPYGRVARRLIAVTIFAGFSALVTKISLDPTQLVDSLLALTKPDLIYVLKIGIGAGLLALFDKLQREWPKIVDG